MNIKIIAIVIAVLFAVSLVVFGTTSRSSHTQPNQTFIGEAEGIFEGESEPIKLVAVCVGEGTETVESTFNPLDESKRTPEEKALAERAGQE